MGLWLLQAMQAQINPCSPESIQDHTHKLWNKAIEHIGCFLISIENQPY